MTKSVQIAVNLQFGHGNHRQSKALQCSQGWTCWRYWAVKDAHSRARTIGSRCSSCVCYAWPKGDRNPCSGAQGMLLLCFLTCSSSSAQWAGARLAFLNTGKFVCSSCTNWNLGWCHSWIGLGLIPVVMTTSHSIALSREKTDLAEHISLCWLLSNRWSMVLGDIVSFGLVWGN